jgi:poly(3-hydroxybutyrate) depolymerase
MTVLDQICGHLGLESPSKPVQRQEEFDIILRLPTRARGFVAPLTNFQRMKVWLTASFKSACNGKTTEMLSSLLVHIGVSLLALLDGSGTLAARSPGCGKDPTLSTKIYKTTINSKQRQYYVRVPENYDKNRSYRLIFTFHQFGSTMSTIVAGEDLNAPLGGALPIFGLPPLANETAIFVVPDGLNKRWSNAGGEDVLFFDDMVSAVAAGLCVDDQQHYATGFSFGGAMSFALACARAQVVRAVAVLSGAELAGCAGGTTPVPYYGQHGTADAMLPIASGRQLRDKFVGLNGCNPLPSEPMPNGDKSVLIKYKGCKEGYPVTWVIHSGGHSPSVMDGGQSVPFAPQNTWDFFSQFFT